MCSQTQIVWESNKLVTKASELDLWMHLSTCCQGQQTVMYIEYRETIEDSQMSPMHTGNRILVAMGNNWIQYGGYIKNREKLTEWSLANRKWICLLPGATTGFQYGRQTWNRGQYSQSSPQTGSRILAHGYYLRESINLMKSNKEIRKQIQHAEITDLSPLQANSDET